MKDRDNQQFSTPQDKPKPGNKGPQLPGDENEKNIRSGAEQEDQLEHLKPQVEDEKAANKLGTPPNTQVDKGER